MMEPQGNCSYDLCDGEQNLPGGDSVKVSENLGSILVLQLVVPVDPHLCLFSF